MTAEMQDDERFMRAAIGEAQTAFDEGEVPVGAVIVRGGRIVGRGHNQREKLHDPTAHGEMIALTAAASAVGSWRVDDCTVYVTLEPCARCAGALVRSLSRGVFSGSAARDAGGGESLYSIPTDDRLNHTVDITAGFLAGEGARLLLEFFPHQRPLGKQ